MLRVSCNLKRWNILAQDYSSKFWLFHCFMLLILHPLVLEGDSDRQFLKPTEIMNEVLETNCVEFAALGQLVVGLGQG